MTLLNLNDLERMSAEKGILLRIKVSRPFSLLWIIRIVAAKEYDRDKIKIIGEMKAWAYAKNNGLQLDTLLVGKSAPKATADLIWTASMAWAIEETPCQNARLLAIRDNENKHIVLKRYFQRRKFNVVREVGSSPVDLPLRMIWGGSGTLMSANCMEVYEYSQIRLMKNI